MQFFLGSPFCRGKKIPMKLYFYEKLNFELKIIRVYSNSNQTFINNKFLSPASVYFRLTCFVCILHILNSSKRKIIDEKFALMNGIL